MPLAWWTTDLNLRLTSCLGAGLRGKEQCRLTDLSARYLGDEFAVWLIDPDPRTPRQIAGPVQTVCARARSSRR